MPPRSTSRDPQDLGSGSEERVPPHGMVCARSHMAELSTWSARDGSAPEMLSLSHGGWCGPLRDQNVPVSCARKVQVFLSARPAVLHIDEILNNKKDPMQVRFLLTRLIKHRVPVQVAFLQGSLPLQQGDQFPRLLQFLTVCPVWSVNLGELRFSEQQCQQLAETLRKSGVTHMFYECTVAGQWKETFRNLIRTNRQKHGMWRLGPDPEQNKVVLSAVKNWYVPERHDVNKHWLSRQRSSGAGEGGSVMADRVQCEACGKWRRVPSHVLAECARMFYCPMNEWDKR
jgi:hypothetical protein